MDSCAAALPGAGRRAVADGGEAFARAIMTTDTVHKQADRRRGSALRRGWLREGRRHDRARTSPRCSRSSPPTRRSSPATCSALSDERLEPAVQRVHRRRLHVARTTRCCCWRAALRAAATSSPRRPRVGRLRRCARRGSATSSSRQLIADGEGATHVLIVDVEGAATRRTTRAVVAKAVADSPLVKAAAFGGDPNPGRVLQAVGAAGVAARSRRGVDVCDRRGGRGRRRRDPARLLRAGVRAGRRGPHRR